MKKEPDLRSPFYWYLQKGPSMFAKDPHFKPRGEQGRSAGQIMTDVVEEKRKTNKNHGTIKNFGNPAKEKEAQLLAYRQFGVYAKATPSKQPNKHEEPHAKAKAAKPPKSKTDTPVR